MLCMTTASVAQFAEPVTWVEEDWELVLVEPDGDLLAHYQQRPFLTWDGLSDGPVETSVLSHGVASIEFLYVDLVDEADDVEWLADWQPEDEDEDGKKRKTDQLPLAVMVTVRWQDGRTESWLRRTSGSGFRERYGQWKPRPAT